MTSVAPKVRTQPKIGCSDSSTFWAGYFCCRVGYPFLAGKVASGRGPLSAVLRRRLYHCLVIDRRQALRSVARVSQPIGFMSQAFREDFKQSLKRLTGPHGFLLPDASSEKKILFGSHMSSIRITCPTHLNYTFITWASVPVAWLRPQSTVSPKYVPAYVGMLDTSLSKMQFEVRQLPR
jgi:hypothetical protein